MLTQERKIPSNDLEFIEDGESSQKLPSNYLVAGYGLRLEGELLVAGGTTSSAAIATAPWGLIRELSVIANGSTVLRSISGHELRELLTFMQRRPPVDTPITGDLDAATYSFAIDTPLPVRVRRAGKAPPPHLARHGFADWGELTSLPTYSYDELTLKVAWGGVSELSDETGDRTETLQNVSTELYEVYAVTEKLSGVQQSPGSYAIGRTERRVWTVDAAGDDFRMRLPRAARKSITRILLWQESDGVLVDTVLTDLRLQGNGTVELMSSIPWAHLQARNAIELGTVSDTPTGYALLDFAEDENLGMVLNTGEYSELELIGTVATPGTTDKVHALIESIQTTRNG